VVKCGRIDFQTRVFFCRLVQDVFLSFFVKVQKKVFNCLKLLGDISVNFFSFKLITENSRYINY